MIFLRLYLHPYVYVCICICARSIYICVFTWPHPMMRVKPECCRCSRISYIYEHWTYLSYIVRHILYTQFRACVTLDWMEEKHDINMNIYKCNRNYVGNIYYMCSAFIFSFNWPFCFHTCVWHMWTIIGTTTTVYASCIRPVYLPARMPSYSSVFVLECFCAGFYF